MIAASLPYTKLDFPVVFPFIKYCHRTLTSDFGHALHPSSVYMYMHSRIYTGVVYMQVSGEKGGVYASFERFLRCV